MLRNWLIVAWRNLLRHRLYTAINIVGLALGLAAAMLIALLLRHELSYDNQFSEAERIWRVNRTEFTSGRPAETMLAQSAPIGPALAEAFPELELVVRLGRVREIVRVGQESRHQAIWSVDPAYFRLFDWPFLEGDRETALARPDTAVLTRASATRLLGDGPALGRTITLMDGRVLTVTGVMADLPSNSSFDVDFLTSIATPLAWMERSRQNWGANWMNLYVLLRPGTDAQALSERLRHFLDTARPGAADNAASGYRAELSLQQLGDIHLNPPGSDMGGMVAVTGLTGLAGIILAIAAINFVNLSTARAGLRAREVALRKAMGAPRRLIMAQFLGETLLLTLLAGLVAVALLELVFPLLQSSLGLRLDAQFRDVGSVAGIGFALCLVLGLAGGFYPAVLLSGYRPAVVLRGAQPGGAGGGRLRTALVVAQFAVAIILAIATATVIEQVRYASSRNLGFDKENMLLLRGVGHADAIGRLEMLKNRLAADPGVLSVAGAPRAPADPSENSITYQRRGQDVQSLTLRTEQVDFGYFATLGITPVAGRLPDRSHGTDMLSGDALSPDGPAAPTQAAAVLSRSAVRLMGWDGPQAALGREFVIPGDNGGADVVLTVIGVVEDVQYRSAREATVATVFITAPQRSELLMVRLQPGAVPAAVERIDAIWQEMLPQLPLQREFLDERIGKLYTKYVEMARIAASFAGLAIAIACLGLFGLAAFTAERRTKEIGIRKVLGAGVPDIVRLLVWQFSRPVLVATLLAWPLAWLLLSHWLDGFVYRINPNPLLFLAAGLIAMLIAWATVAAHAARVARARPVQALRYE